MSDLPWWADTLMTGFGAALLWGAHHWGASKGRSQQHELDKALKRTEAWLDEARSELTRTRGELLKAHEMSSKVEFKAYQDLWTKVVELSVWYHAAAKDWSQEGELTRLRIELREAVMNGRPFYAERVFELCTDLVDVCEQAPSDDVKMRIAELADDVTAAIRRRIHAGLSLVEQWGGTERPDSE